MSEATGPATTPAPVVLRPRTITAVTATAVAVPRASPVRWATREISAREYVLVRIEAGDAVGTGYTYAGVAVSRSLATFIADVIAPRVVGLPWDCPTRPWAELFQETVLVGRRGFAIRALSAVDLALWDLLGQVTGESVSRLLGGVSDRVPAYASGGYYRPGDPLAAIDREIGRYLELGFRDVKIKVGGLEPEVDAARVERARSLIGPTGRLALDANNRWAGPAEAIRFIRMVERSDPWWIEEPLAPDDIEGHAEIARSVDVPVATGEIHSTRWDFANLISRRAADILQPDAAVIGGISEWIKVAHAAAVFDLPVAPHWNHEVHVQLAGAVANCLTVEWFDLAQDIVNLERLLREPVEPHDGSLEVPTRPGLGIRFDDDAVNRYAIGR